MPGKPEGKVADVAGRRGKVMARLVAATMLACLGACSQTQPTPGRSTEQAPGSFSVQIGGRTTTMIGTIKP